MKRFLFVHPAVGPVTENTAVHRHARKIVRAHSANQGIIERLALPLVALPNVDPHHFCFALDLHVPGEGAFLGLDTCAGLAIVVSCTSIMPEPANSSSFPSNSFTFSRVSMNSIFSGR